MSRYETYLRKIAGEDIDISNMPEPSDRIEGYLKTIAENGAGADPEAIAEAVTDWLDEHVDPDTGYVIDNTLLVEGAAADAKKVGDELSDVKSAINNLDETVTELVGIDETITPTWTTSKRLNESGAVVNSGDSFGYTDKITIIDADEQKAYGLNAGTEFTMPSLHFYNSSDEHIGYAYAMGDVDLKPYITQYNPAYIRISHYAASDRPFNGVSVKFKTSGSIVEIESDITTMQGDISSLDGRTGTLESNVETLSDAVGSAIVAAKREPHNLLNGIGITLNKRWQANASASETANNYTLTDLIEIDHDKYYAFVTDNSLTGAGYGSYGLPVYYAQFDEDGDIILQENNGYTSRLKAGATTKYVRISYGTSEQTAHPIFAECPFTGELSTPDKEITEVYKAVSPDEITFKGKNQQHRNLLDGHRDSLAKSKYLSNGLIISNANFITLTDYIPCESDTEYNAAITDQLTFNPSFKISWYEENGTYISENSHANNTTFTSPENAKFLRISTAQLNQSQLDGQEDFSKVFLAECDAQYGPPCIDPSPIFTGIYPMSSLYGKKWVAFGDSITEKNVRATINYHDYIRAETGITVINKGLGGAGYKCRWQNENNMFALADAFDFTGVDVVTCMAGINDAWSDLSSNMGDADDAYDTEATAQNQSVMACFNHFLDVVIASAPFAKIGIISPLPCWTTQGSTDYHFKPDDDTSVLAVFVEKCKTACRNRGIPYLDLFHTSGLRPWDSTFNNAMFKCNTNDSPDGLHPNHLGHKFFYPLVREFVKNLI